MRQSIRAIPTTYRGVNFRSRLEARYAAFFDAVRWPWRYEPIDLDGYIPDFVLEFEAGPLLIEIKPRVTPCVTQAARDRICDAKWDGEAAILLSSWNDDTGPHPSPGDFGERINDVPGEVFAWGPARFAFCLSCGQATIVAEDYSWRCRVCGVDDGNGHLGGAELVSQSWVEAANRVQWRPS